MPCWGLGELTCFFLVNFPLVTFEHWINVKERGWSVKDKMNSHIWEIRAWVKKREKDSNFYHGNKKDNSVFFVCGAAATRQLTQTCRLISTNTAWAQPLLHHLQTDKGRSELSRIRTQKKKVEFISRLNFICCVGIFFFFFLEYLSLS